MREPRQDCRHLSDDELAELAREGRSEAWNEIARRHTHRVVVSLLARGMALDVAEDLTQETWLRLMERSKCGKLETIRLPGLAIAQAGWLAREAGRTLQRREAIVGRAIASDDELLELGPAGRDPDPERGAMQRERLERIQDELSRCSPRAQQVFRAVYGADSRSHADVARETGLSLQRVRQILCEVRARLRRVLEDAEGEGASWNT